MIDTDDLSQRALILLRDAIKSPVEVVARKDAKPPVADCVVVRTDRCGFEHRKRTLDSLVRTGHLIARGAIFVPTDRGLTALGGL
jgi:hypothetical protein